MFKQFMTHTASHNLNAAMSLYQINLPKQESVLSHTHTQMVSVLLQGLEFCQMNSIGIWVNGFKDNCSTLTMSLGLFNISSAPVLGQWEGSEAVQKVAPMGPLADRLWGCPANSLILFRVFDICKLYLVIKPTQIRSKEKRQHET